MPEGERFEASLARLERLRHAELVRMGVALFALVGIVAGIGLLLLFKGSDFGALFFLALGVIAGVGVAQHFLNKIRGEFKQEILPVLLADIDPSLRYDASECISESEFSASQLYQAPDRYSGKDLIAGRLGETTVKFSLVHAEEEYETTETDTEGNTKNETHYRTIFLGLMFIADFNKEFSGRTCLRPKGLNILSKLFGTHVELEDPEFNHLFSVSSTNQVEARYLLTPSLMERFKSFHGRMGDFRSSFTDGNLCIAVSMPWNAFEPSVTQSLKETHQIERIRDNLEAITGIVDHLGLNVRIWSKTTTPVLDGPFNGN